MALLARGRRGNLGFDGNAWGLFQNVLRNPQVRNQAYGVAQRAGQSLNRMLSNAARNMRSNQASTRRNNLRGNAIRRGVPVLYKSAGRYRSSGGGRGRIRKKRFGKKRPRKGKGKGVLGALVRRLTTPMTYKATVANNGVGFQNLRQIMGYYLGGEAMLQTLAAKKPSNFLFNTALSTSSTAVLQDPGGTNYRLCVDRWIHDMRIQNRSNASMELTVYECMVRHDVASGTLPLGSSSIQALFNDAVDLPTFIGQGLNNLGPGQAVLPTGMTHNYQNPTFTPYDSNEFCTFFKVVKTKKVMLGPNEIMPMKYNMRAKSFRGDRLSSLLCYEYLAGWTKLLLFSWVGMPVDDGTTANQGKAKCDLFIQDNLIIKYHFAPGTSHLVNYQYGNAFSGTSTTYSFNPAAFTGVVPASDTIEVVPGTANFGTAAATDSTQIFAP